MLPAARGPGRHAEVASAILLIERTEVGTDQNVRVRPRAVRAPCNLTVCRIERRQPSADTHFAAAVTDEHFSFDYERRHRHGLATVDVADANAPDFGTTRRIHCHDLVV